MAEVKGIRERNKTGIIPVITWILIQIGTGICFTSPDIRKREITLYSDSLLIALNNKVTNWENPQNTEIWIGIEHSFARNEKGVPSTISR